MESKEAKSILDRLAVKYPNAGCELKFENNFQLLVAVILSAQCTDKRVNAITEKLFKLYSTPKAFAELTCEELEKHIYSCGFYHNKAKNIIAASQTIVEKYNGELPESFDDLLELPGVGRKTANVVVSVAFGQPAMAVDTHVFRVSKRLGMAKGNTPDEVERELRQLIPIDYLSFAHHVLIFHGRYCCKAINPNCSECPIIECKNRRILTK